MTPYLQDLLQRMQDDSYRPDQEKVEGMFESEKTVYYLAYQEARMLNDRSLLSDLVEFIEETEEDNKRESAYFILGFIAKNTADTAATQFLLTRLTKEKKPQTVKLVLERLAELFKPATLNIDIVKTLIEKRGYSIRHSAYNALTNSDHGVEDYLLDKLKKGKTADDIASIIRALGYIGRQKSIVALKPLIKSRKFVIKHAVQNHLSTIMVREGCSITEICRATKVSTNFVKEIEKSIVRLTRPG